MGLFDHFPYTNVHELNLDWVLRMMKALEAEWEQFTAGNSLTFADPLQHDISKTYAKNTIVLDGNGNAYVSLQAVPVGAALSNQDYWLMVFDYEAFLEKVNKNFTVRYYRDQYRATAAMAIGDWLTVDDVLCKATAAIAVDDVLEVGVNIEHFTLEDFIKAFMTSANQMIQQYKNDIDASELAYRQQLAQDIANTTSSLQAQFDAAIAGATVDSEVINARVGADGTIYPTLGDAIRDQVSNLDDFINDMETPLSVKVVNPLISGKYINAADGSLVSNVDSAYTEISVKEGDFYRITTTISNPVRGIYAVYDANNAVVGTIPAAPSTPATVTEHILIPTGGVLLRACRNSTNNPIIIERLLNVNDLNDDLAQIKDNFKFVDVTPNATLNYYVSPNGNLVSNASSRYIEYWRVREGERYIYNTAVCASVRAVYVLYDASMNVIDALPASGDADINRKNYLITIPSGCALMRLTTMADSNNQYGKLYKYRPDPEEVNDQIFNYGCQIESATGYGNMGRVYTTNDPIATKGILVNIKVTVNQDGQVDFYRMKRVGNAWFWKEWIGSYPVQTGSNLINCFCPVDAGDYIATWDQNSCKIGYNANLPWSPGIMFDSRNFNSNYLNIDGTFSGALCLAYSVIVPGERSDYALMEDKPSGILYSIKNLVDDGVAFTSGWSNDVASRTADSYVYMDKKCWEVDFHDHIVFTLENGNENTTVFDVVQPYGGFFVRCDLVNKQLTIHKPWSGDVSDPAPAVLATESFTDFPITYDRKYVLDIHAEMPRKITVTFTDSVTLDSFSFDFTCTSDATIWGVGEYPIGVILRSGFVWLRECYTYTSEKISPLIQIYGDSYSLGYNLIRYGYDYKKCWSYLLKDYFDGDVTITARGGKETSDAVPLLDSDMIRYRPKYIVFELGINENLDQGNVAAIYKYKENMTYFVEAARKVNAIPILVTVPRLNGAGIGNSIDSFLNNYKIGIRVFDMGAVLCYDDISYVPDYSQGWYLPDSHPSVSGNQRMFDRFILDFNDLTALNY